MFDARRFWGAVPYPHLAVDDFFPSDFFSALSRSMSEVAARSEEMTARSSEIERNKHCFAPDAFDDTIRTAVARLSGLTSELEPLLGVSGLIPNTAIRELSGRSYFHVSTGGGFLGSHVDESFIGRRWLPGKKIHVLSAVFYGSPQWKSEDGGHTILFDKTGLQAVTSVECRPNRLNLFLHTSTSFHGVSEIRAPYKRFSIYMDFFLPHRKLRELQRAIVANNAKCSPEYWLHPVVFIPNSHEPYYRQIHEAYLRASTHPL